MTAGALAFAFKQPIFAIDKDKEADDLAGKLAKVLSHYGDIPGLNEKTLDWLALIYTAGIIVGPRVMAVSMSRKKIAAEAPKPSSVQPAQQPATQTKEIPGLGKVEFINPEQMQ